MALTPRDLRRLHREKKIKLKVVPEPPSEWRDYRRERLAVAIQAAVLFIRGGMKVEEVRRNMKLGPIRKQRVAQYISKGATFLVQRSAFLGL